MEIIVHRVNTLAQLRNIPDEFGCEIDIRSNGGDMLLNHNPFEEGDDFRQYVAAYGTRGTLILNIKETGIEQRVLETVRRRKIQSYFLLDVEFPYFYRASRHGERAIAVRYSEAEPIENVITARGYVDWVWIDVITRLPLDENAVRILRDFKTCLVCPGCWGRAGNIPLYREQMRLLDFEPTAVMTDWNNIAAWQ